MDNETNADLDTMCDEIAGDDPAFTAGYKFGRVAMMLEILVRSAERGHQITEKDWRNARETLAAVGWK